MPTFGNVGKMNVESWYCVCNTCQWRLKVEATQPYRDWTWRIELICRNYDCHEHGITQVIEVKE